MPLIGLGIAALVGAAGGYVLARGTSDLASIAKWSALGVGVYVGAKALKVI